MTTTGQRSWTEEFHVHNGHSGSSVSFWFWALKCENLFVLFLPAGPGRRACRWIGTQRDYGTWRPVAWWDFCVYRWNLMVLNVKGSKTTAEHLNMSPHWRKVTFETGKMNNFWSRTWWDAHRSLNGPETFSGGEAGEAGVIVWVWVTVWIIRVETGFTSAVEPKWLSKLVRRKVPFIF